MYGTLSKTQFAQKLNVLDITIWQKDTVFPNGTVLCMEALWRFLKVS